MSLSKSKKEFIKNSGWSSELFFDKAVEIIDELEERNFELDFERTVLYIKRNEELLKVYVHRNDKSKEYITFTDSEGDELKSFHYTDSKKEIVDFVISFFSIKIKGLIL